MNSVRQSLFNTTRVQRPRRSASGALRCCDSVLLSADTRYMHFDRGKKEAGTELLKTTRRQISRERPPREKDTAAAVPRRITDAVGQRA